MQTFVPYGPAFIANASCLDNKRLGKQRVECLQIVNCLTDPDANGWRNHPAVKMWDGYVPALVTYGLAMCAVWVDKGFKDTCAEKMVRKAVDNGFALTNIEMPPWIDDIDVMRSHRSNLIRKLPEHYSHRWPGLRDDLPYKWPV